MYLRNTYGGRYRLEVRRDGIIVDQTGWFDNLITDSGLDYFAGAYQGGALAVSVHVGTGTTPPAVTDTELEALVATGSMRNSVSVTRQLSVLPYYISRVNVGSFGVGTVVGTISECGIGSHPPLFSRSLIQDQNGNPTTLTVTAADELFMYYELRHYIDTTDFAVSFDANGVTQTGTGRVEEIDTWTMNRVIGIIGLDQAGVIAIVGATQLAAVTSSIGGSPYVGSYGTAYQPYVMGSHERLWQVTISGINGTINAFSVRTETFSAYSVTGGGRWQMLFSPGIPITGTQTMTLNGKLTWGRYTP